MCVARQFDRLHRHKSTRDKPRSSPIGPSPPSAHRGDPSDGKEEKGIKESGSNGVMRSSLGGASVERHLCWITWSIRVFQSMTSSLMLPIFI